MPNISIKITNLAEIRSAFSKAPVLMSKELSDAINRSLLSIGGEAAANAPKLTSLMASSVNAPDSATVSRGDRSSQGGLHLSSPQSLKGWVGPTPFYSIFVHEGTRFMSARPFLLNAVNSNEGKVQTYFRQAVQKVFDQIGNET